MTGFKPKQSTSDSDIQEKASVVCLDGLLSHPDIKTHFSLNDKIANTDGKIELLTDRLICGNITVQIKTYPKKYYGKSKYDFPTSIFGYAESCPIELVFLIAVDTQHNIAYWKNIDKSLIIKHEDKYEQDEITIHFEENEIINRGNIDETITRWKELYKNTSDLINQVEEINYENEQFKIQLKKYQNPDFTIRKEYIIKLQKFIDKYNHLLDFEYNYIKRHHYLNPWKIAIVIFEYGLNEISYIIHKIEFGENGFLVKEIPIDQVKDFTNYSVMYRNCSENSINDDPEKYAFKLIQDKVIEMLENKTVLFLTEDTAIEYIFDFITKEGHYLGIKQEVTYDLTPLIDILNEKYPNVSEITPVYVIIGKHRSNLNIFYDCIKFLIEKGFTFIYRPYPPKEHFGKTGFVSDFYTPDLAFKKVKFIYELLPSLFDAYMITAFPYLRNYISFFDGYDLILVNLSYFNGAPNNYGQDHQIVICYLRLCEGRVKLPELDISLNYQSGIYLENSITSYDSMVECFYIHKKINHQGEKFEIMKMGGENISSLFEEYYIHNMLYKYLTERFKGYFETENKK
jgi:hypothetical protein